MNQPTDPQTGALFKRIRRRLWIVVLCALVGAGIAYHNASSKPQRYEAAAQLLFGTNTSVLAQLGVPIGGSNGSTSAQATNAGLAGLPVISTLTQRALGSHVPPGGVNVSAVASGTTNLVEVIAQSFTPSGAVEVANTYARQFVLYTQTQQLKQVDQAIVAIRREIAARRANGAGTGGTNLGVALANLETVAATNPVDVSVVQTATSASLVGRKTKTKAIEGLLLGGIVGIIVAMLLDWFDPRLRDVTDDEFHGLPVITLDAMPKQNGAEATTAITRRLLQGRRPGDAQPQLIAITSTGAGREAHSARQLGAALAQTAAANGLSAGIVRVARASDAASAVNGSGEADLPGEFTRTKLAEGVDAIDVSPQALLHGAAARDLEAELRDSYRLIIVIDERPSEFSALAPLVKAADVTALVLTLGRTNRRAAADAAQGLARMGCAYPVVVLFPGRFRAALQKQLALQPAS